MRGYKDVWDCILKTGSIVLMKLIGLKLCTSHMPSNIVDHLL